MHCNGKYWLTWSTKIMYNKVRTLRKLKHSSITTDRVIVTITRVKLILSERSCQVTYGPPCILSEFSGVKNIKKSITLLIFFFSGKWVERRWCWGLMSKSTLHSVSITKCIYSVLYSIIFILETLWKLGPFPLIHHQALFFVCIELPTYSALRPSG